MKIKITSEDYNLGKFFQFFCFNCKRTIVSCGCKFFIISLLENDMTVLDTRSQIVCGSCVKAFKNKKNKLEDKIRMKFTLKWLMK